MKKFIDFLVKYKIFVILVLAVIGLGIIISVAYVSAYHKHPIFEQEKIELSDPHDNGYITFDTIATTYKEARAPLEGTTITNGSLKLSSTIKATDETIKNIEATFLLTTFWDKDWEAHMSEVTTSFTSSLTANQKAITKSSTVSIKRTFPSNPIWFVTVEHPTLYVRVTFETVNTQILDHEQTTQSHTLYFKYEYEDFVNEQTKFE